MRQRSNPTLFGWAVIRVSLTNKPEIFSFLFTGIGVGHPRLDDFVLFATTEVQEIAPDQSWGRTKSRYYNLELPLAKEEFTAGLMEEIKEIFRQERSVAVEVEWISVEDWRSMKAASGIGKKQITVSAAEHGTLYEDDTTSMSDEEVEAILAAARKRGEALQKSMIAQAGPFLSTTEAAKAAGLPPEELEKRMNVSLLAIPMEGGVVWPSFQFESSATMAGVARVVKRLGVSSPWMQLNFFLMHLEELEGIRPIDAIRMGKVRAAEIAASHFGTHGGS